MKVLPLLSFLLVLPSIASAQKLKLDYEARFGRSFNLSKIRGESLTSGADHSIFTAAGQLEKSSGWYAGGGITYNQWKNPFLPSLNLTAEYYSQRAEWFVFSTIMSSDRFVESSQGIKLTPSLSFEMPGVSTFSLYQRIGVGFFIVSTRHTNPLVQGIPAFFKQEHYATLQTETGVGYRDLFLTFGYSYGLTKAASGNTGNDGPYHQRYHAINLGIAYHPRFTKRMRALSKMK